MVPSAVSSISYAGNNSTVTAYVVPFKFFEQAHLEVKVTTSAGVETVLTTGQFTVTGLGVDAGGTLKTVTAVPASSTVSIKRKTPLVNSFGWSNVSTWNGATLEKNFDWLLMAAIDSGRLAIELTDRALRVPDGQTVAELSKALRAGKFIGFDADGALAPKTASEIIAGADVEVSADVAAALQAADDAVAAKDAAELAADGMLIRNEGALLNLRQHLRALSNVGYLGGVIGLAADGDSIVHSGGPWVWVAAAMQQEYGMGGLMSVSLVNSRMVECFFDDPAGTPVMTGGCDLYPSSVSAGDYTYGPNGCYFKMPAASTITEKARTVQTGPWTGVTCIYGVRTGGGSLAFALKVNGVTVATKTVSTAPLASNAGVDGASANGAAGTINTVTFTAAEDYPASGDFHICGVISLLTTCSTAESHYIGSIVKRERGILSVAFGRGGNAFSQLAGISDARWQQWAALFNVEAFCHAEKGEVAADINAQMAKMKALFPGKTHICIGNSPVIGDTGDVQHTERNAWLAAALANNFCFVDGWSYFKSWEEVEALGFEGDNVHLSDEARILWAEDLFERFRPSSPMGDSAASSRFADGRLMTAREWAMREAVGRTTRIYPLLSDASSTLAANVTATVSKGRAQLDNSTSAAGDSVSGLQITTLDELYGYQDFVWRFELFETMTCHFGPASPNGMLKIAHQAGYAVLGTINAAGLAWEFGCDAGPLPWVRFHLSDGTHHQVSEKYFIPVQGSGNAGYSVAGIASHKWAVVYRTISSTQKEFQCWVTPVVPGSASGKVIKPILVAIWRPLEDYAVWSGAVSNLTLNIGSRTTAPPQSWFAQLRYFEKDLCIAGDNGIYQNRPWR